MSDWAEAYKRYRPDVLAFLRERMWSNQDEAEDLCQETFARVLGAASELRDPSKARSYLLRTANNLLINRLRRGNRVSSESELGENFDLTARADKAAPSPHDEAERSELRRKVSLLLERLPRDQRVAFEQGVIERRPYAEIAQAQNWSTTKVKVCVYRARKQLMASLGEYSDGQRGAGGAGRKEK